MVLAMMVSVFLSLSPTCEAPMPANFFTSGTATFGLSVCMTAPPTCGITYGIDVLPASAVFRVNSRIDLPGVDISQPPTFPFNLGAAFPADLGYTTVDAKPMPAMTKKEIARYNITHTGQPSVAYQLKLRMDNSVVSVNNNPDCTWQDTPGPQYTDVPLDGKLPPPQVRGIRR